MQRLCPTNLTTFELRHWIRLDCVDYVDIFRYLSALVSIGNTFEVECASFIELEVAHSISWLSPTISKLLAKLSKRRRRWLRHWTHYWTTCAQLYSRFWLHFHPLLILFLYFVLLTIELSWWISSQLGLSHSLFVLCYSLVQCIFLTIILKVSMINNKSTWYDHLLLTFGWLFQCFGSISRVYF